jgi:hypothetical protein
MRCFGGLREQDGRSDVPQSEAQKETIERVMHEAKHGELKTAGGGKVKNPKQAIAIALHEAGATNRESPAKNARNLRRTKAKESRGETYRDEAEGTAEKSRDELYAEAKRRGIAGRSKMNRQELAAALGK